MSVQTYTTDSKTIETLAFWRDELRLQVALGKAELREQWEALEPRWQELETRLEAVEKASAETGKDLKETIVLLADEIREGYRRIREAL
jgi:hypothetical protein